MFYGIPPRVHTGGAVTRRIANVRDRKVFEFFGKIDRDTLDLSTAPRYVFFRTPLFGGISPVNGGSMSTIYAKLSISGYLNWGSCSWSVSGCSWLQAKSGIKSSRMRRFIFSFLIVGTMERQPGTGDGGVTCAPFQFNRHDASGHTLGAGRV